MRARIDVDDDAAERELDRLINATTHATPELEAVLARQFNSTQAEVHVITGSLRGSGHPSSQITGGEWEGTISYGGPSPGRPNNPVKYAWWEQSAGMTPRTEGGPHDFMPKPDPEYQRIVEDTLSGAP